MTDSKYETDLRIKVVNVIKVEAEKNNLGLLLIGSIAWGKYYAVTSASDIDIFIIYSEYEAIINFVLESTIFTSEAKKTILELLSCKENCDTVSLKTSLLNSHGAVYFISTQSLKKMIRRMAIAKRTKYFLNLRPISKSQSKLYKSTDSSILEYVTPVFQIINTNLFLRKDPLILIKSNKLYGSIFLSQVAFGEIMTDIDGILFNSKKSAQIKIKSFLNPYKAKAFEEFKNYLPRVERMNDDTINVIFTSIWQDSSLNDLKLSN